MESPTVAEDGRGSGPWVHAGPSWVPSPELAWQFPGGFAQRDTERDRNISKTERWKRNREAETERQEETRDSQKQ